MSSSASSKEDAADLEYHEKSLRHLKCARDFVKGGTIQVFSILLISCFLIGFEFLYFFSCKTSLICILIGLSIVCLLISLIASVTTLVLLHAMEDDQACHLSVPIPGSRIKFGLGSFFIVSIVFLMIGISFLEAVFIIFSWYNVHKILALAFLATLAMIYLIVAIGFYSWRIGISSKTYIKCYIAGRYLRDPI